MEYIRYIWHRNVWKIVFLSIGLLVLLIGYNHLNTSKNRELGRSYLVGSYSSEKDNNTTEEELFFNIKKGSNLFNEKSNKPIIISEFKVLKDSKISNILASFLLAISVSLLIFIFVPVLLRNTFVNKTNLRKDLKIPFLAYYNSHFKIDKKAERKKVKVQEIKEEQLGELVAKIFANSNIKNKNNLLFISDGLREDKINIVFELSRILSNLDKKVLIIDMPLELTKEMKKVEKKELKTTKREQIKKLTTFNDKLVLRDENVKPNGLKIYSSIDKNVKYCTFDKDNEEIQKILLNKNQILKNTELDKFEYILVNGVDSLDPERYIPLSNMFQTVIVLTKHFRTETEKLETLKWNTENTDIEIVGTVIVKKEKYSN